ncbi:MAG: AEC family transporter [Spirochaetaceae bacterium]
MDVLRLILPLFIIILVGYLMRTTGFAREGFVDELNRLVYFVGLPATLFIESSRVNVNALDGATAAVAFPFIVLATTLIGLAATLPLPFHQRGPVVQAGFRGNLAYLGLPIVSTTLGPAALATITIIIAAGIVIHTLLSILVLSVLKPHGESIPPLVQITRTLTNPLLIAIALGLLFAAGGWSLPDVLARPIDLLARMSLPLILLVLGLSLSFSELRRNLASAALASLIKLAVMPAVAWAVMTWIFDSSPLVVETVVLMAAMPTAVASQTFARAFEADSSVSASSVSLSTLLAVGTVPVVVVILGG